MKRKHGAAVVFTILACWCSQGTAQITSVFGELRYQQQYHDLVSDRQYTQNIRMPQATLGFAGDLFSPSILTFSLQSSVVANFNNARAGDLTTSMRQWQFYLYNMQATALNGWYTPLTAMLREHRVETNSEDLNTLRLGVLSAKQRQQRFTLSTRNIDVLPKMLVQFLNTHDWSDSPITAYDKMQQEYSIQLSQANERTGIDFSTSLNSIRDVQASDYTYSQMHAHIGHSFTKDHHIDVQSEYYSLQDYHSLSHYGILTSNFLENLRGTTTFNARNLDAPQTISFLGSSGQSLQYVLDENIQFSANATGQLGRDRISNDSLKNVIDLRTWQASGAVNHTRTISGVTFGNMLEAGAGDLRAGVAYRSLFSHVNNSIHFPFLGFLLTANQNSSFTRYTGYDERDEVTHRAGGQIIGTLPFGIETQTQGEFQDDQRTNTTIYPYRRQMIRATEMIKKSLYFLIPITLQASGSIHRFRFEIQGETYAWSVLARSDRFILQNLSVTYSLNRSFDIYYKKALIDHTLEMTYQWRAISAQLRLRDVTFDTHRRELWLNIIRPFRTNF